MDGIAFSSDGAEAMGSWIDQELAGCRFADARLEMLSAESVTLFPVVMMSRTPGITGGPDNGGNPVVQAITTTSGRISISPTLVFNMDHARHVDSRGTRRSNYFNTI
jgi:hypothetical protein